MITIAALFVRRESIYKTMPGVDAWDEDRDARKYDGPYPVVAHPPCGRWCKPLAKVNQTRYGHKIGDDGGCFKSALESVRRWGGVLEHPAYSYAWDWYGLQKPRRGAWTEQMGSFTTEVSQSAYGHKARKRTWLLYVGADPPALDWSDPPGTHLVSFLRGTSRIAPRITKDEADKTPPAFAELLVSLARAV
jgi:hypothetical protein